MSQREDDGHLEIAGEAPAAEGAQAPATFTHRTPTDDGFEPTKDEDERCLNGPGAWRALGVSLRGLSHQHRGSYREDALDVRAQGPWFVMAVADGAGSCPLSRIGSREASQAAVKAMATQIQQQAPSASGAHQDLHDLLHLGMQSAYHRVQAYADELKRPVHDFFTTLLLAVHREQDDGQQIVAAAQIGDGAICAFTPGEAGSPQCIELATADVSDYSGYARFLNQVDPAEWPGRIHVTALPRETEVVLLISDGVADDFIPLDSRLWRLLQVLQDEVLAHEDPSSALSRFKQVMRYQHQGSFDDRTALLIHRRH